ncbi:hypothetical protein ACA910_009807 [Epithemia clementina (nom. ined.)]
MKATKALVSDPLWMVLTKDDFEQWCIASNHELPDDSGMTSISLDLTDDFDDCNLASLFDLPADDEMMSMFADIADNFDNWNLALIFEPPNDDAAIPGPDLHFHAHNHTSANPLEAYGLSHTSVNLPAQNGEQFNACDIKIIGDPDKDTKKTFVAIDNLDKETKKTIGGINNHEITVLPLTVHLHATNHSSSVTKSLDPYHHGEDSLTDLSPTQSSMKHNMKYPSMNNQTLQSPLHRKCYNMAQEHLLHVATLTNKMQHHNELIDTSSISSHANLYLGILCSNTTGESL